jgi:hypothetical protein
MFFARSVRIIKKTATTIVNGWTSISIGTFMIWLSIATPESIPFAAISAAPPEPFTSGSKSATTVQKVVSHDLLTVLSGIQKVIVLHNNDNTDFLSDCKADISLMPSKSEYTIQNSAGRRPFHVSLLYRSTRTFTPKNQSSIL